MECGFDRRLPGLGLLAKHTFREDQYIHICKLFEAPNLFANINVNLYKTAIFSLISDCIL